MANKILEYKNRFRIKAPICESTHDFARKLNGTFEDIDCYIDCSFGVKVFYYGHGVYSVYIPSIGKGHNILKQLYYENINPNNAEVIENKITREDGKELVRTTYNIVDNNLYESELKSSNFFPDIRELDSEMTFRFRQKDFEKVIPLLKPKTSGAGISPFSSKNLPVRNYEINADQLREYKEINDSIPQEDKLKLSKFTSDFIHNIMAKKRQYRSFDMTKLMRKQMLKGKEFIHQQGFWDEYIKYLKKNLGEIK